MTTNSKAVWINSEKKISYLLIALFISFLTITTSKAQLLQWNTFGNAGTETTESSVANDPNISGPVNLTLGAGVTGTANGNRFGGSGWFDTGNTAGGNTLAEAIAGNSYIEFIVTPNVGFAFSPTSLVFTWDRSSTGPSSVTLRSSADGFTADLGSVTGMSTGGSSTTTSRTITITTLTNISVATTFRLYGYAASATTGTGGFDNASSVVDVQLNGTTAAACAAPVLAINATTPTCAATNNGAIDLAVSGGTAPFLYNWSNGASTEDLSNVASGTYTVTVTSTGGCTTTQSATVNAIALPIVNFSGLTASICTNTANLTLTGNQAPLGTFTGTGITDNGNGTATFNPVTANVGGPYTITYSYTDISTGCANTQVQSITVNNAPNIAAIAPVSNTCPVVSFDLSTIALTNTGAAGTSTYYSSLSDANSNSNAISSSVSTSNTYYIRVTTITGCFDVESVVVTISNCGCANPPGSNAGSNFSSCANVNAPLNGIISGSATTGTWSGGAGVFIPNATTLNATYTPTAGEITVGSVTLTLTTDDPDAEGSCVASASSVTITLLTLPAVTVSPTTASICAGSSTGSLIANGALTYNWTPNNGTLNSTSGTTVIATPITTTTYTVTGTGANGCSNTATVTVTINALPSISTDLSATAICNGASTGTITATGGVNYAWAPATGLNGTTGASVIANPVTSTIYTVTGSDANGCSATATVSITVNQKPAVTISGNAYACIGAATTLDAGAGFANYNWSTSATTQTISVNSNGTFTVTVTDGNACTNSASQSVVITNPPVVSAAVTAATCNTSLPGTIDLTATGGTPCNINAKGLIISKISSNPTGNDSPLEFVELIATKDIDFSVTPYTVIFTNNGTTSAAGWLTSGNVTYAFSINTGTAVAGGVYYVGGLQMPATSNQLRTINTETTNGDGGIGTAAAGGVLGNGGANADAVAVFNLPVAAITSTSVPIDAVFFGSGIGASAITGGTQGYQLPINDFYNGGKLAAGSALLPDFFVPANIIAEATGTYDVQNNSFTTPRTFTANALAFFNEGISSITLTNTQAYFYNWSNSATTQDLAELTAGTYTATVTDCNGCSSTISKTVLNVASPIASFTSLPASVCSNATAITLTGNNAPSGTFTGMGITDNADGTATFNPSTAGVGGPYAITYSYTDPLTGCTGTQTQNITVNGLPDIQTIGGATNDCPTPTVDLSAIAITNNGVSGTSSYFATLANANNNINSISPVVNATNTYYIRVTTVNGCYDVEPVTVTINGCGCANPPVASAGSNFAICANGSALLNGSIGGGATTLTWTGGAGTFTPNNTTANATYTPTSAEITAGSVTLTITTDDPDGGSACLAATSSVTITINALPGISLNTTTVSICIGAVSDDITASGGIAYSWSPAIGLSTTTGATVTANPASSTTYTVTGTDINGCTNTATVAVTVNLLPLVSVTPSNPTICLGSTTSLTADGATSYSWANAAGLSATTGTMVTANPIATTIYTVTATDVNTCSATATVEVVVNALPVVTIIGNPFICNGSSTSLDAGNGFVSYFWSTSETTQTISTATAGTYTVTVTDGNGCSNSASSSLTISNPPVLTATTTASSCNTSAPGTITLNVSGGAPCAVNSAGLIISKVLANPDLTDSPFEFVELVATKDIDFSVTPYAVIFANNGTATTNGWKAGSAITYGFQISSGTAVAGSVYYVGGSSMIPTTNRLRVINTGTTLGDGGLGNSNATGVLGNGGTADGIAVFAGTIAALNSASVPVDAFLYGSSIGAALVAGGAQGYQLPVNDLYSGGKLQLTSFRGPDPVNAQYCKATGTYNAITNTFTTPRTFANNAVLNEGVSGVTVITAAPYAYSWSNGMTTQNLSGLTAGTYTVTVTDCNGCTATLSKTIVNTPNPTASINGNLIFCAESSTTLDANGPSLVQSVNSYLWSTGETTQTISVNTGATFTLTVTDANGCSSSTSVTTTVNPLPTPSISGSLGFCAGSSSTLDAGSFDNYSWSTGATTQTISVSTAGTFTVTVTDANGCLASAAVVTTVFALPTPVITGNSYFCFGGSTLLDAGVYAGYNWSTGATIQNITVSTVGTYTVTVTDANGCTGSTTKKILIVNIPATPGVITGPTEVCKPNTVTYFVAAVANATSYNWTVGAGATITSGAGTNVITVQFSNSAVNGSVTVNASNVCFTSGDAALAYIISGTVPAKPALMTGSFFANCNVTNVPYSCSAVAGATSYLWTVPAGVTILSGQTTNSIVVKYGIGFSSTGVITVQAVNACGSSAPLSRSTSSRLNTPVISGANSACKNDIKTYTVLPILGATSYTWTVVSGSTLLSGQGTTSMTVKWGNVGGVIKCTANNACGASIKASYSVSTVCPKLATRQFDFSELNLFPNPASTSATLQFDANTDGKGQVAIYDLIGQQLLNKDLHLISGNNQLVLDLNNYPKGIYSIRVSFNGMIRTKKLIVQ